MALIADQAADLLEFLERVKGIEPSLSAWEADVLPLNYTRAYRQTSPGGGSLAVLAQTSYRKG